MERKTHTINAEGKSLGRIASKVAHLLRGKHKPQFNPRKDVGDFVVIENIDQIDFKGKKLETKKYYQHSDFLGGMKEKSLPERVEEEPGEVVKDAVYGMLPKNKLREEQIKRLKCFREKKQEKE